MRIRVLTERFDPWQLLKEYQAQIASARYGATTVFIGTMRDFNEGHTVTEMRLEHYPEMTQTYLEEMVNRVSEKYQLDDALLVHRVGEIRTNEPIILLAVWSQHRHEAYLANREMMEDLKSRAPFWKKEKLEGHENLTERWVQSNTSG